MKLNFHEQLIILPKENFDKIRISSALRKNSVNQTKKLGLHFVYAGLHYLFKEDKLRSFIWNGMKRHKIKSVMLTSIYLGRSRLITKEKMESHCMGEEFEKDSVNNDLESLFEKIRLGNEPDETVQTYFLPKLTEEELELVERRDANYLQTFIQSNPDVYETEMVLSESDSKYVRGRSWRKTFVIENSSQKSLKNKCSLQ